MLADKGLLVRVQERWDGWHSAEVRLGDVRDVHWLQPDHAPHPLVHAGISCADIVSGDIPHVCDPESAPHLLLVCILKKHALPSVYAELARRADQNTAGAGLARSAAAGADVPYGIARADRGIPEPPPLR